MLGDTTAALDSLSRAIAVREQTFGPQHIDLADSLTLMAETHGRTGSWDDALAALDRARRIIRGYIANTLPSLSEAEQLEFLAQREQFRFENALSLGLFRKEDPKFVTASAEWLLNGKGLATSTCAQSVILARQSEDPAIKSARFELARARAGMSALVMTAGASKSSNPAPGDEAVEREGREAGKANHGAGPSANGGSKLDAFGGSPGCASFQGCTD
jgi:hypothetical protein